MKQIRLMMDMPITLEVVENKTNPEIFDRVFAYFHYVDEKFSLYKDTSEISLINRGQILEKDYSPGMRLIFNLAEKTRRESYGYFNIRRRDRYDPSGIVKGWAIRQAARIIEEAGFNNFYVDAGGDIQVKGKNNRGKPWRIGIKNPFRQREIIKVITLENQGVATSGTYLRGQHIYNPKNENGLITEIISLTVIGPDIYEADRFATAAFAMGKPGISFIEGLDGFEGYLIDNCGQATYTSGFDHYVLNND